MTLGGTGGPSRSMTAAQGPQRFKLSLPFLNRKKKRKNLHKDDERVPTSGPDDRNIHLQDAAGLGDILQDIAEENEEQLHEHGNFPHGPQPSANGLGDDGHGGENDEDNLTAALVPKAAFEPEKDSSISKGPMSYKSFDIPYPPGGSPPSRRRTERSSSMKALDASTRSGSLRTESTSSRMSIGGHSSRAGRGWLSTRCGFRSCSKQIDMEAKLRSKDRAAHGEKQRSQRSRTQSSDRAAWETDTVSEWSVLAAVEKDARKKSASMRKKKGHKKSSKLAPSPGISPSEKALAGTPEIKCSLSDAYEEVREAAKYDLPSQRSSERHRNASEKEGSQGSQSMSETPSDLDDNSAGERARPWERSVSSRSSDEELFTTSLELDGKTRKKKWSSNSSDEVEGQHRRPAGGSHGKSKSTWSSYSLKGTVQEEEDEMDESHKSGKKGSRIIFLSTPPRPEDLGMDEDEPSTNDQILLKSSSDRFGEYSKLEPGVQVPRIERTFSVGYQSNPLPVSFESDMEANAKAWSKLDVRTTNRADDSISEVSVRELPMVSKSKEPGKRRFRHIDVQIEDQLVNLRLESDVSDSSQGKGYAGSRGSKMTVNKNAPKPLDQDRPVKKKRGLHRRRRARKAKAPPPLPNDLHGKVKESVAVVKSSYDPYTDFRDSMVEMIVEKEIQGATDLEELLRCYLSLNSAEYHAVIVKVFADVWRELFADAI